MSLPSVAVVVVSDICFSVKFSSQCCMFARLPFAVCGVSNGCMPNIMGFPWWVCQLCMQIEIIVAAAAATTTIITTYIRVYVAILCFCAHWLNYGIVFHISVLLSFQISQCRMEVLENALGACRKPHLMFVICSQSSLLLLLYEYYSNCKRDVSKSNKFSLCFPLICCL